MARRQLLVVALPLVVAASVGRVAAESVADGDAEAAAPPSGEAAGVAVCFVGKLRALARTIERVRDNLLLALQPGAVADAFLYAPKPSAEELARLGPLLTGPTPLLRAARFDDEADVLESLGRDHREALLEAMRIPGNWLGSLGRELFPGSGDRRDGVGVFALHAQRECLAMVKARESRRGYAYGRIVLTRTDLLWLHPHPPLSKLRSDFVWIPDTGEDDFGGLYDKHLVLPRPAADRALDGWGLLTSKAGFALLIALHSEEVMRQEVNTERYLASILIGSGLRIARFPMTAYTTCDLGTWVQEVDPDLPAQELQGFECAEDRDWRYPHEHKSVYFFADCFELVLKVAAMNPVALLAEATSPWSHESLHFCYCRHLRALAEGEAFPDRLELCF